VGIVGALAITAWRRHLTLNLLREVCKATVRTTAMASIYSSFTAFVARARYQTSRRVRRRL
jgi:TRAP-type mannitol/chloroaromatic compound transport system permease large subunit